MEPTPTDTLFGQWFKTMSGGGGGSRASSEGDNVNAGFHYCVAAPHALFVCHLGETEVIVKAKNK